MITRTWRIGVFVLGFAFVSTAVAGESIEQLSKRIAAASAKLKSFSVKSKTVIEVNQEGFSMRSTTETTTEMLRKGKNFMTRSESTSLSETTFGGNTTKQESTTLMISDGEFTYSLSDMAGTKKAYKTKAADSDTDPLELLSKTNELKVLPDASVDGHAVWVIEAKPKSETPTQGKTIMSFHKESGQMIKMVAYALDGKPMTTTTSSDIKVNPKLSADRFVFTAPAGVEVIDRSK